MVPYVCASSGMCGEPLNAKAMQELAPMRALAEEFTREGVRFDRPVIDYETLWEI